MSTSMYAAVTRKREEARQGTSESDSAPAVGKYLDTVAALVPGEVLAFYVGLAIPNLTAPVENPTTGVITTTITNPGWLAAAYVFCLVFSVGLYLSVHSLKQFNAADPIGVRPVGGA